MIKVKEPQTNNILHVTIQDKVTEDEINTIAQKIKQTLTQYNKVRMYLEIPDFEGYSLKGFFEDLKQTGKYLSDFEKVAVVTNESWLGKLGSISDLVIDADIKYFKLEEAETARQWVAE